MKYKKVLELSSEEGALRIDNSTEKYKREMFVDAEGRPYYVNVRILKPQGMPPLWKRIPRQAKCR